jgi:hypothetical protein
MKKRCFIAAVAFTFALPVVVAAELAINSNLTADNSEPEAVLRVPEDHATIQAALDAAPDGGTVLVAPGVYGESLRIAGKSVTLASRFLTTGDSKYVDSTVLDGSVPAAPDAEDDDDTRMEQIILVEKDAGPKSTIVGMTIRDGDDGISCHARIRILFNRFVNNDDAIDYEDGGGECRFNRFMANDDDAVDYDGACDGLCANNEIRDNDDDGVEVRLQPYRGDTVHLVIRDNVIVGNGEDGVQIIDYPELSDRTITIERNLIARNAMAGIGCMSNANSKENYEGAPIPEPISVINNTIVGNQYGITGGSAAYVINNVICDHPHAPLKNIAGNSVLTHNLLWRNGARPAGCTLGNGVIFNCDPQLDADFRPTKGRVCIDSGKLRIELTDAQRSISPAEFQGAAPDLGAYELE